MSIRTFATEVHLGLRLVAVRNLLTRVLGVASAMHPRDQETKLIYTA